MEKSQDTRLHLGFIVDGNRRWAKEKGLPTLKGHQAGLKKVEETIEALARAGKVAYASFYLFSTENWQRSKEEVGYLMRLAETKIIGLVKKMAKNNIKCVIMGSDEHVDAHLLEKLKEAEALTKDCTGMTVCICFNYGGKKEIVDAVNSIIKDRPDDTALISEEDITAHLYHPEVPPCDMIIRTSGEERISGFMLWRAAYSEFLFLEKYFPDLTTSDIDAILTEYEHRHRRFGK